MEQVHKNSLSNTSESYSLRIDRDQAITQIEALGHQLNTVCVRAFLPKEDKRYAPNAGRKANQLDWKQIEQWQAQGYGIYIVVNGGGHKDENITDCRAVFCEFDDRPIEDQINFWQDLKLPEPSLQIATRKSVHTYWIFDQSIAPVQWRFLQTALLEYTGSDRALKNPSRVMRLAGAYHTKPGHEPLRCDIIHQSVKRYSYQELRSAVPLPQPPERSQIPLLQPELNSQSHSVKREYQRPDDILVPVPQSIPLEVCLSKQSRSLLASGCLEGERNVGGAKLVRDLIGTANHLAALAQPFNGEPHRLLEDYASRCTPILDAPEIESIWKSAQKDNPTPSCKREGVEACIRGWYWKNHVLPNQSNRTNGKSNNHHAGLGFSNSNSQASSSPPPIAAVTLCDRISKILNGFETESEIASALMDLAYATGRKYNEISQLAKIIRSEGDLADEVIAAVESLGPIFKSCQSRLNLERYLDTALVKPLLAKASSMPTAPEYLFNSILAASASRIGTACRIIVNPHGGYKQPCVFWTANVNHSGQAKTPPQQVVLEPLEEMEAAASLAYEILVEDYEQDKDSNTKPPVRQRRLLSNVTTSTKIRIHSENQRGLLEYLDELVADYQRLNQYKSGKGDDLQLELGFWNGAGCNYDRHDARLFMARTGLSKTGTYQWDTLARLMADEVNFVASGYSARFLYCSIQNAPARYLDLLSPPEADTLKKKLSWLYAELEKLPEVDYLLTHEAKVLFQGWNHTLVNAEIEEKHFGLSLVYAKIESYTARLALWLHLVNAVLRGEKPAPVISGETMQHAIEIACFYLDQQKLIHAHNAPSRQPEGIFLKVQTQALKVFKKSGSGVSASFLKTRINALKGWATEKIRTVVFKALTAAGHGRVEGEGSFMVYIPNHQPNDSHEELVGVGEELVTSPIAQSTDWQGLQTMVGGIGDSDSTFATNKEVKDQQLAATIEYIQEHQFTNPTAETTNSSLLQPVGDITNSSPVPPIQVGSQSAVTIDQSSNMETGNSSHNTQNGNGLLEQTELQHWLNCIASAQSADECMDCIDALSQLPPPVNELILTNSKNLLPRFWEILAQGLTNCQSGEANEVLPQQQIEPPQNCSDITPTPGMETGDKKLSQASTQQDDSIRTTDQQIKPDLIFQALPPVEKPLQNAKSYVKNLIAGLWVRTRDGFYGHLGAMVADGRWWVKFPKSRTSDAESRLYAAADIIPMPI